jgi:hypothetical protein
LEKAADMQIEVCIAYYKLIFLKGVGSHQVIDIQIKERKMRALFGLVGAILGSKWAFLELQGSGILFFQKFKKTFLLPL